jgi:hypothetical protein
MLGLLALLCSGCGSNELGTVKASAKLTYKGEPLAEATVTLVPQQPSQRSASGVTDASGVVHFTTLAGGDGAIPGSYKVTVTKTSESVALKPPVDFSDVEAMKKAEAERNKAFSLTGAAPPKDLLPTKYKSGDSTPLKCDVHASGSNEFNFELN